SRPGHGAQDNGGARARLATGRHNRNQTAPSVWSAWSVLPLSNRATQPTAGASSTHSIRFARHDRPCHPSVQFAPYPPKICAKKQDFRLYYPARRPRNQTTPARWGQTRPTVVLWLSVARALDLRRSLSLASVRKVSDLEIAEPNFAAMFLQQDVTFDAITETRDAFEFARSYGRFHLLAATGILEDFGAVQPVFDMASFHDNA